MLKLKPCGIVRHLDNLGRIVIPHEIRRDMCLEPYDSFELFYDRDTGTLVLKKYGNHKPARRLLENAKRYISTEPNFKAKDKALGLLNELLSITPKED
jgi:bifunctional DNA-binding transcriptional regulator/antitoxin component of YhaV-PrlF toxin-antitoxin module